MWRLLPLPLLVLGTACDAVFGLRDVPPASDSSLDAFVPALERDLVAHYALDALGGNNASIAVDSAGHHDAICMQNTCPTLAPSGGHVADDNALAFNPVGAPSPQFLLVAASEELQLAPEYTIALWIRVDGAGGCAIQQTFGSGEDNAWQFCVSSEGQFSFFSVEAGLHDALVDPSVGALPTIWTHVALVHTATSKVLYRNGVELLREDIGPPDFSPGAATYIGADVDDGSMVTAPFEGAIDEVRIYARALSPNELGELATGDP
jgi:Concanavalin A-like lectin/glucanases superfamily